MLHQSLSLPAGIATPWGTRWMSVRIATGYIGFVEFQPGFLQLLWDSVALRELLQQIRY
jgi:hypothetical protein